jgi:hypothetical protein
MGAPLDMNLLSCRVMSLAATVALLNLTSRIITGQVHIGKNLYKGEFSGIFADRDIFFLSTDRDREDWHDGSTFHITKS